MGIALIATIALVLLAAGMAVGARKLFPYPVFQQAWRSVVPASQPARVLYTTPNAVRAGKVDGWLTTRADIVMFGDSITAAGRWHEIFPGRAIVNRGVSGDTVTGALERAPDIVALRPKVIFVLVGINDVAGSNTNAEIAERYSVLLDRLTASGARVVVQSVLLPRGPDWIVKTSGQVIELNRQLAQIATTKNAVFLDLNDRFTDGTAIRPQFTYDGVHINAEGYRVWRDLLVPLMP